MRQRKSAIPLADAGEVVREIGQMVGDEVDHLAFALDLAAYRHHARGQHDTPLAFKQRRPDHQVGDTGLILDRDEHDALGGSRPLPDQDQPCGLQPSPVPRCHRLRAGDDAPPGEVGPEKLDRMMLDFIFVTGTRQQ